MKLELKSDYTEKVQVLSLAKLGQLHEMFNKLNFPQCVNKMTRLNLCQVISSNSEATQNTQTPCRLPPVNLIIFLGGGGRAR